MLLRRVLAACLSILIYIACAAAAVRDWHFGQPTHLIPTAATVAFTVLAIRYAWRRATADERSDRADQICGSAAKSFDGPDTLWRIRASVLLSPGGANGAPAPPPGRLAQAPPCAILAAR